MAGAGVRTFTCPLVEKCLASASTGVAGRGVEYHACLRRYGASIGGWDHHRFGARRSGASPVSANIIAEQCRKISVAFVSGRNGGDFGSADAPARSLITEESEQLVLDDCAAQRSAKLVPADGRIDTAERIRRVEEVVAKIFECRSVQMVGPGFRCRLQQCARDVAELRVVVAGSDLEFFEDVRVRIDHGETEDVAMVFGTIQQEAVRIG